MSKSQVKSLPHHTKNTAKDTISHYMTDKFIMLQDHISVREARDFFLMQLDGNHIPGFVFIVAEEQLRGILSIKRLLRETSAELSICSLMESCMIHAHPDDSRHQIAAEIREHHLLLLPVIEDGRLVGALTEKEIENLLADETTEDAQLQGASLPLEKPYLETSPITLWRKRSVWLLLLFVAEAYTSSVIQHFEEALESAIALAFFIPLLIGTGGNSGTQITSTLVRSMALGEVRLRDMWRVIRKEATTSLLIAFTLGIAGCIRAWMMGIGPEITLIVSLTLVCITLWSAVVSSVIPMVIKRAGIDPAVVSAPFIATLIDGTGLIIYFKIAQYFLGLE